MTAAQHYAAIRDFIGQCREGVPGLEYCPYLDEPTARAAMVHVELMEALGFPPPRVFGNGEDCFVFTWAVSPEQKVYFGVTDEGSFTYTAPNNDWKFDAALGRQSMLGQAK